MNIKQRLGFLAACAVATAVGLVTPLAHAVVVVHYDFNGNVLDSSGLGNDGTIVGTPAFVAGESDEALYFNNPFGNSTATQYVDLPNTPSILALGNASFSLALKYKSTDTSQQNGRLFGNFDGLSNGLVFDYNAQLTPEAYGVLVGQGDPIIIFGHSSGTVDPRAITTDGNWHWAVLVVSRDTKTIDYYVDSNLIDSLTYVQLHTVGFANLSVGRDSALPSYGATLTTVDDFRLYDTALSADEVARLPEPATLLLFALGGLALVRRRW